MRTAVRDRTTDEALPAVTLSLGVAVFPDHGRTADAVLGAADVAMYEAKQSGPEPGGHGQGSCRSNPRPWTVAAEGANGVSRPHRSVRLR